MPEIKITMLGPSSVGKTSLLTAVYEQSKDVASETKLQLTAIGESADLLQNRLKELKTLPATFSSIKAEGGITGSDKVSMFRFNLGKRGKNSSLLTLQFLDYPGKYHEQKKEYLTQQMTECVAVLIAIDAAALMEEGGKWHEYVNIPQQITELFENTYINLNSPRLVILAPIKCEKYMQDRESIRKLHKAIQENYRNLLNHLGSEELLTKVAVVITPVQTVGSVFFSRIHLTEDGPQFVFRKLNSAATYNPKGSEQVLRYLLSFLLKCYDERRLWGFSQFIRTLFNKDTEFKDAIRHFTFACISDSSSEVVQGQLLLTVE
ncbi:hypothetical protein H6F93_02895 [Leptolyngbya sp. FACHB-671]|uniref:hypothetical protein n=1 Tax=Leptolyngbya sp. FACHB-671 TaxID=2692812 RepID=UPI00168830C0|nr:hypothetical protein [Leptolyngbya sp. FACHB-671]MBD1867165.1 hypothetical protein [Cyanobacteria bacterium FACHB-471]MBD2066481.1 hypothetical protein [Leptolyngbya sp. FACHB-671]